MAKTGSIAISFITVYSNLASDNYVVCDVANIEYSGAAITVAGHKTIVTPDPAKILYNISPIVISGNKTIVMPEPALMEFQSTPYTIGLVEIVTSIPGNVIFVSDNINVAGFETIVIPNQAEIEFSGANDIEVIGYKTIITPDPAKITFSSAIDINSGVSINGVSILLPTLGQIKYAGDVNIEIISHKTIVSPTAAQIEYSGGNISTSVMNVDCILPSLTLTAISSSVLSGEHFDLMFPDLTVEAFTGTSIEIELPSFTLSIDGSVNGLSNIAMVLPILTASITSGCFISANFPTLAIETQAFVENIVSANIRLQSLSMTSNAIHSGNNFFDITIPKLLPSINAKTGEVGNISALFNPLTVVMTALPGELGVIACTIPALQMRMSSIETGENNITMAFESMELFIKSGEIESIILRYIKGLIR